MRILTLCAITAAALVATSCRAQEVDLDKAPAPAHLKILSADDGRDIFNRAGTRAIDIRCAAALDNLVTRSPYFNDSQGSSLQAVEWFFLGRATATGLAPDEISDMMDSETLRFRSWDVKELEMFTVANCDYTQFLKKKNSR